jgi:hypothetical protein
MNKIKSPASEEAGRFDRLGSFAVTAGPDQREGIVGIAFDQRGVDRSREAWIVELDREIFAIAFVRGLLPGGAELGCAGADAIVRRLVIVLFGCDEGRLDVERERFDRAREAVVRGGEGTDSSHGVFRSVVGPRPSQPRWRSLAREAIGPQPSGPQRTRRTA